LHPGGTTGGTGRGGWRMKSDVVLIDWMIPGPLAGGRAEVCPEGFHRGSGRTAALGAAGVGKESEPHSPTGHRDGGIKQRGTSVEGEWKREFSGADPGGTPPSVVRPGGPPPGGGEIRTSQRGGDPNRIRGWTRGQEWVEEKKERNLAAGGEEELVGGDVAASVASFRTPEFHPPDLGRWRRAAS